MIRFPSIAPDVKSQFRVFVRAKTVVGMENVGALSPVDGEEEDRMRGARRTGWSESCRGVCLRQAVVLTQIKCGREMIMIMMIKLWTRGEEEEEY